MITGVRGSTIPQPVAKLVKGKLQHILLMAMWAVQGP